MSENFQIEAGQIDTGDAGPVGTLLLRPPGATALLVLGHGAGAGMRHAFMERVAAGLAHRHVATLRYQFPYMEAGRKRPDRPETAMATATAAVDAAVQWAPDLPLFAGGKSFGGRMTAGAAGGGSIPAARGLVFLGFPLHPAGRPSTDRAAVLDNVAAPMLFLQGTRDRLADLQLLRPVLTRLGPRAALHVVDGADHSFDVLKRSGRTADEVMGEICDAIASWLEPRSGSGSGSGSRDRGRLGEQTQRADAGSGTGGRGTGSGIGPPRGADAGA